MPIFSRDPRTLLYSKQMQVEYSRMLTFGIVLIKEDSANKPSLEFKFAHLAEEESTKTGKFEHQLSIQAVHMRRI